MFCLCWTNSVCYAFDIVDVYALTRSGFWHSASYSFFSKSEFVIYKLKEMGKISEKDILQICNQFNKLDPNNTGKITLPDLLHSSRWPWKWAVSSSLNSMPVAAGGKEGTVQNLVYVLFIIYVNLQLLSVDICIDYKHFFPPSSIQRVGEGGWSKRKKKKWRREMLAKWAAHEPPTPSCSLNLLFLFYFWRR